MSRAEKLTLFGIFAGILTTVIVVSGGIITALIAAQAARDNLHFNETQVAKTEIASAGITSAAQTQTVASFLTPTKTSSPTPTDTFTPILTQSLYPTSTASTTFTRTTLPTTTPTSFLEFTQTVLGGTQISLLQTLTAIALPTQTFTPPPTLFPQIIPSVTAITKSGYPCPGQIISHDTALLDVVHSSPATDSPLRDPIQQGLSITIIRKTEETQTKIWYEIADLNGNELGWLQSEYLVLSNCPQ